MMQGALTSVDKFAHQKEGGQAQFGFVRYKTN